jgi:DNA-binding transcriptional regulator YdaS (Cro superfamily)
MKLSPEDRHRIAERHNVNPASLYQTMTGKGAGLSAKKCVEIQQDCDGLLQLWDLRPNDWHQIWPMLIGIEGAPGVPAADATAASHSRS